MVIGTEEMVELITGDKGAAEETTELVVLEAEEAELELEDVGIGTDEVWLVAGIDEVLSVYEVPETEVELITGDTGVEEGTILERELEEGATLELE